MKKHSMIVISMPFITALLFFSYDARPASHDALPQKQTMMNNYLNVSVRIAQTTAPASSSSSLPVYDAAKYKSLAAAVSVIGTKDAVLLITNEQSIQANMTLPANIRLRFQAGGRLNIKQGVTFKINGPIEAGLFQIFTGKGLVNFTSGSLKEVYPQWWGAKGDGKTDDTLAIQMAINAYNVVFIPSGIYILGTITPGRNYLENRLLSLRSNVSIIGTGKPSVLKLKNHLLDNPNDDMNNAHIMGGYDISNISINKLYFDMNGANNLTPQGKVRNAMAIFIMGGNNLSIRDSYFYNCAGHNMITLRESTKNKKSYNATIVNNVFKNGGRYVGSPIENINNTDFSFMYVVWDNSTVEGNLIEQEDINIAMHNFTGGLEIHGSGMKASNNKFIGCDPAVYIASQPAPIENITVSNNTMNDCFRGISFYLDKGPVKKVLIDDNSIVLSKSNLRRSGICAGIEVPHGGGDKFDGIHANAWPITELTISNNSISENLPLGTQYRCDGLVIHSLHTADISNNNITGLTGEGVAFLGSPWGSNSVNITNNTIQNCGRGMSALPHKTGIFFRQDGFSKSPALPFYANNINISGNTIGNTSSYGPLYFGITLINLSVSKLTDLTIANNSFSNLSVNLFDGKNPLVKLETVNPEAHFLH
jgi:hypothetical protein